MPAVCAWCLWSSGRVRVHDGRGDAVRRGRQSVAPAPLHHRPAPPRALHVRTPTLLESTTPPSSSKVLESRKTRERRRCFPLSRCACVFRKRRLAKVMAGEVEGDPSRKG
eukprot:2651631-Rhodomonas_salina.1